MIEVKNLVKRYGNHLAVDHISFTVEKGQVLGFLGPNGAGKSTTMNMLTGYISATEGSVSINGHDIYDDPEEAKKCIGYLPEIPPVYPDMTVREYLNFVAQIRKTDKKIRAKMLNDIMKDTGVFDVKDRLIKHLSKGYRQRVGLAQALVGYPELIILDEPTVGLDPMQIIEIRDLIKKLAKEHTIILSSHILSEVSAVCDTVMIINKGKIIVSDKPENLAGHLGITGGLHLTVKGDSDQIRNILAGIVDAKKIQTEKPDGDGHARFTIMNDEKKDIREEVFYKLAEAKLPILEMTSSVKTLEEIFLEVTREDDNRQKKNRRKPVKEGN